MGTYTPIRGFLYKRKKALAENVVTLFREANSDKPKSETDKYIVWVIEMLCKSYADCRCFSSKLEELCDVSSNDKGWQPYFAIFKQ